MFISSLFNFRILFSKETIQRVHYIHSSSSYRFLATASGLTALLGLRSHYFQADLALNCLQKDRAVVQTHIAYFIRIDMCYNITFLDPTVEFGDASRNLKIKFFMSQVLRARQDNPSYDIRNKQSVRV